MNLKVPANESMQEPSMKDIIKQLDEHLDKANPVSWLTAIRAHVIRGRPLLDDLGSQLSSSTLHIEFDKAVPTFDEVYLALRHFGRMSDLKIQTANGKTVATAQFRQVKAACAARGCLHNSPLDESGAVMLITYEQFIKTNVIKKMIMDHPRLSVPAFAASLVGVSYLVFDPLRIYSIDTSLSRRFSMPHGWQVIEMLSKYKSLTGSFLYRWTGRGFGLGGDRGPELKLEDEDFPHRVEAKKKIKEWLKDEPGHILLVSGPKGYGKTRLVHSVASDTPHTMIIRCDTILNGSERDFVKHLADEVGYFPVFASLNALSTTIDMLITSTTGAKANLTTSTRDQFKKIFEMTSIALTLIVNREMDKIAASQKMDADLNTGVDYPTIIISNFCDNNTSASVNSEVVTAFQDELMDWAVYLTVNKLARIIFVSSTSDGLSTGGEAGRELGKKVITRVNVDRVPLGDSTTEGAMTFLERRIGYELEKEKFHVSELIHVLGGRLSDLQYLVSKVKSGASVRDALEDLLNRAEIEVRRRGLFEQSLLGANAGAEEVLKKSGWTQFQFWLVMKEISKSESVSYDAIIQHGLFGNDPAALQALERHELISITHRNGRPHLVKASKALFGAVFKTITSQVAIFDLLIAKKLFDLETAKMKELEKELVDMATILQEPRTSAAVGASHDHQSSGWLSSGKNPTTKIGEFEVDADHPLLKRYQFLCDRLRDSQKNCEKFFQQQAQVKIQLGVPEK